MARFGIVGGGMLGMTLAFRLAQSGHDAAIFESAASCGGLAAPWRLGDVTWDRHYHVTLFSDSELRGLLDELELAAEMQWITTKTGFFVDGNMHSLSDVADFLRFPPLSLPQKARLAATILTASRISDWRPLERISAVDWLTRLSGRATVEKLWLPLLRAKLGPYAERASAAFIWAIIVRMYAARRAGMKRELFGYMQGGYDRTLRRFETRLREMGVQIYTSARVERVERLADTVTIAASGVLHSFDYGVVTLVPQLAARLCPTLLQAERERCESVEYQGIICASLLTKRPLSPYYVTNITAPWVPFTAVIEMTALVDRAAFSGRSLIYLPKYVPPSDRAFEQSDGEIQERFLAALERMHPAFSRDDVSAIRVSRVRHVMPVPTLGYSERVPPIRTATPGLYLASSANIVNGTLNVNETVTLANRVARTILADAAARRQLVRSLAV